jgi:hypothetical protein
MTETSNLHEVHKSSQSIIHNCGHTNAVSHTNTQAVGYNLQILWLLTVASWESAAMDSSVD